MRDADDHRALQLLSRNREVIDLAINPAAVRLLWEVCQIPDFRKVMSDSHARFLAHCFCHLGGRAARLPSAWIGSQMAQLDRLDGDIDTLMARIAHIRTWTYITHRGDWVDGAVDWQERARSIEDRLSDACIKASPNALSIAARRFWCAGSPPRRIARLGQPGGRRAGRGQPCRPPRRVPLHCRTRSTGSRRAR
jgi:hypothetical protein